MKMNRSLGIAAFGTLALPFISSYLSDGKKCTATNGAENCQAIFFGLHGPTHGFWLGVFLALLANALIFKKQIGTFWAWFAVAACAPFMMSFFWGDTSLHKAVNVTTYKHEWSVLGFVLGLLISAVVACYLYYLHQKELKSEESKKDNKPKDTPTADQNATPPAATQDLKPYIELITARGAKTIEEVTDNFLTEVRALFDDGQLPFEDSDGVRSCPVMLYGHALETEEYPQTLATLFVDDNGSYRHMLVAEDGTVDTETCDLDPQAKAGKICISTFSTERFVFKNGSFYEAKKDDQEPQLVTVLAQTLQYLNVTGLPVVAKFTGDDNTEE